MATTPDEDLSQIERDIRRLKIEYEQFFGGGRSRPPADTQWRLETTMRRYNDRMGELTFAQRFRYNNLAQTYAKYVEMWRKKTQQKEGAVTQHHFGISAKTLEASREAALRAGSAVAEAAQASGDPGEIAAQAREAHAAFATTFVDPERENEKIQQLYERMLAARSQTGETSQLPSLSAFERFVCKKTKELRDQGGNEVEYSVSIEAGRVKLKARVSN